MNQSTKIRAIRLVTLPSAAAQAPKTIKLFVNRANLGFDDAESEEPAQEIEVTEAQARGDEAIQLRFVRFQNVSVLSVSFLTTRTCLMGISRLTELCVFHRSSS